ncbi:hypothetical protein K2173_001207 [Erythroxylum novogranatense]|uniref:C2 domain-containing protein n=1 Tax=Erythroxylum novogranatense TaxID=1862640 RepID=A0AAV8T319_9ROSI|nr:hypothetical protein K2173_001207 [Erythroxylum novogranatense]
MENIMGLLRIHVNRGLNLAIRDARSSDPYLVVKMGKQKLKTRVVKKNVNPEWNEDLTLLIIDPNLPIKIEVFDRDLFSRDDRMGDAEFDIRPFTEAVKMNKENLTQGTVITRIQPNRENCVAEESHIIWADGKVVQNLWLRLQNVESGEVEFQLQWIDVPGSRGL